MQSSCTRKTPKGCSCSGDAITHGSTRTAKPYLLGNGGSCVACAPHIKHLAHQHTGRVVVQGSTLSRNAERRSWKTLSSKGVWGLNRAMKRSATPDADEMWSGWAMAAIRLLPEKAYTLILFSGPCTIAQKASRISARCNPKPGHLLSPRSIVVSSRYLTRQMSARSCTMLPNRRRPGFRCAAIPSLDTCSVQGPSSSRRDT